MPINSIYPQDHSFAVLKTFSYILAFYLLLVAVIPCCLPGECHEEDVTTAAKQEDKEDCGSCSPFFHCEGCIAVSIASEPARFELTALGQSRVHNEFPQPSLPEAAYEFWQPPRLG